MDPRLLPLNGLLALLAQDGAWFNDLAAQGFRLHGLELDVQSEPGVIRADAVLYREAPDLLLFCECKCGVNVEERQARGYSNATVRGLRSRASVPAPFAAREAEVSTAALFVAVDENAVAIEAHLHRLEIDAPVLVIGRGVAELRGRLPNGLERFAQNDAGRGHPPTRVRVDRLSPVQEFMEIVVQRVGAAQAQGLPFIEVEQLSLALFPGWARPGVSFQARRELRAHFIGAVRELERSGFGATIRVEPGGNDVPARILIMQSPSSADPRGAPQAWQAQARRAAAALGRTGAGAAERVAQLSFDDLDLEEAGGADTLDNDDQINRDT